MDIPALFSKKDDNSGDLSSAAQTSAQPVVLGDPLANVDLPESETSAPATTSASAISDANLVNALSNGAITNDDSEHLEVNDTVATNDESQVGEFKMREIPPAETPDVVAAAISGAPEIPKEEPKVEYAPEIPAPAEIETPAPEIEMPTVPEIKEEDPEKLAFIKTYTQEFDEALLRATGAAQKILDSIDAAIRDRAAEIDIPEAANEFLAQKPDDGKVQKFEDARAVVREVMAKATEAKQQSEAAAEEAAKVYDEVQAFKKETKEQIAELTEEDENLARLAAKKDFDTEKVANSDSGNSDNLDNPNNFAPKFGKF